MAHMMITWRVRRRWMLLARFVYKCKMGVVGDWILRCAIRRKRGDRWIK